MPTYNSVHGKRKTDEQAVVGLCPTNGKRQFISLDEANEEAKKRMIKSGWMIDVYPCDDCPYYHLYTLHCTRCDQHMRSDQPHVCQKAQIVTRLPQTVEEARAIHAQNTERLKAVQNRIHIRRQEDVPDLQGKSWTDYARELYAERDTAKALVQQSEAVLRHLEQQHAADTARARVDQWIAKRHRALNRTDLVDVLADALVARTRHVALTKTENRLLRYVRNVQDRSVHIIHDDQQYHEALQRLETLIETSTDETHEDRATTDEKLALSLALHQYESSIPRTLPDPIDAIRFRMEQLDFKPKDMIPYLGSRSKVSEVLNRKRPLSLAMMRRLHQDLGIPAEVLLGKTAEGET